MNRFRKTVAAVAMIVTLPMLMFACTTEDDHDPTHGGGPGLPTPGPTYSMQVGPCQSVDTGGCSSS
jgi:hypothetical protein